MKNFLKGFFITLILLVTIGFFIFFMIGERGSDESKEFTSSFLSNKNKYQILLLGVDSLSSGKAENTRSDVMMLIDVNEQEGKINIVSLPRDSRVEIEGHGTQKLNHAYAFGGADLALQTVNQNFGLEIPYYMIVDYTFVKEVVDIVEGIEMDVPIDMDYEDPTADPPLSIHLKQGRQLLDGDEALQFLRFRKGYKNADLDRVKAQQAFMSAFLQKLKSKETIIHLPQLFFSYLDYVNSNMPTSRVTNMGISVMRMGTENINTATLPGTPKMIDHLSYVVIDKNQADLLFEDMGIK